LFVSVAEQQLPVLLLWSAAETSVRFALCDELDHEGAQFGDRSRVARCPDHGVFLAHEDCFP
jgi:hypothetical protein